MKNPNDDAARNQIAAGLPPDTITDWEMMFVAASRTLLLKFSTVQSGMRIPRLFVRRGAAFETRSEAYDAISDYIENY